ncbi:MAG: hypothetical protein MUC59_02385 [Saprospiraceae bacterium]|jgi:hypothetical protein|nr:hypothetical protein [Saprospiraceae bacterium]
MGHFSHVKRKKRGASPIGFDKAAIFGSPFKTIAAKKCSLASLERCIENIVQA